MKYDSKNKIKIILRMPLGQLIQLSVSFFICNMEILCSFKTLIGKCYINVIYIVGTDIK